jgi:hypothetical protein
MNSKSLATECIKEIGVALKKFGTYSFDDKGPTEVMDVDVLVKKFRKLSAEEAGKAILELAESKEHDGRCEYLATTILCDLQDWDELFDIPGVADYL